MEERKPTLVFAGNEREFWTEISRLIEGMTLVKARKGEALTVRRHEREIQIGDKVYRYVDDEKSIRGWHGVEVEFWGSAHRRKDFQELLCLARMARRP